MTTYLTFVRVDEESASGDAVVRLSERHGAELQSHEFLNGGCVRPEQSAWNRANAEFVEDYNALVDRGELIYHHLRHF